MFLVSNNLIKICRLTKMSGKAAIERIKENADIAKKSIDVLKNELSLLTKEYNVMLTKQLQDENAKLLEAVEKAKQKLVQLEVQNGIKQIPLPKQLPVTCSAVNEQPPAAESIPTVTKELHSKPQKEKSKPKEQKVAPVDLPVDIGRLDLRIGKIEDVQKHPDADTLYVLKINCGEEKPRTVCSGLVKHIPAEELADRTVMVLCNLKPVKMRGITSEAMVMCASSDEGVEVLLPPGDSLPGDLVYCEGYERRPDPIMNPKKKIFETIAPDLHTDDNLQACYKNTPLNVAGKGHCVAKTMKNVAVK